MNRAASKDVRTNDVASRNTSGSLHAPPMAEHAMVTLSRSLFLDSGRTLPSGARGAIVFVHGEGDAYVVEFITPFHVITTVPAGDLVQDIPA